MIVDLHAHYPMHLISEDTVGRMKRFRRSPSMDWFRVLILKLANQIANYEQGKPAVTIENLRTGNVGVALSVLYSPFSEVDLDQPYGAPPSPAYINEILQQIQLVEQDLLANYAGQAAVAHNTNELQVALAVRKPLAHHPCSVRDVRGEHPRGQAVYEVLHAGKRGNPGQEGLQPVS